MDVAALSIATFVAFNTLLQLQRWLHQHLFKVGWLVTKNFQTTTILYYTFFLPGVVVYELTVWLVAGMLNVRAERALHWPEAQEIGELRLNFVQLARRTSAWKNSLIQLSPLVTGLVLIWIIGINVLDIPDVVRTTETFGLSSVSNALGRLTGTTDFWLWAYLMFTIGNTMLPNTDIIRSWRWVLIAAVLIIIPLIFLGVAEQIIGELVSGPLAALLDVLIAVFLVIIVFDLFSTALLALIENTIEYITGDSATFKNGKMVVMTREEAIAQRKKERELARRRQSRTPTAQTSGPPSIYNLAFPIPGPPGQEPVTSIRTAIVEPESKPELPPVRRQEPTIISAASRRAEIATDLDTDSDDASNREPEVAAQRPPSRFDTGEDSVRSSASQQRPAAFSRGPDEQQSTESARDDERESSRSTAPYASRRLQPRPFASGDDELDEDEEESSDSLRSSFSGAIRPSPFSINSPESNTDNDDESSDRQGTSTRSTSGPFQPNLDRTPGNPSGNFSGIRPAPKYGNQSDEGDDEDDEDLTYEDVEDSV